MTGQSGESGETTVTQYAIAFDVGHGLILRTNPSENPRWNERMTLNDAIDQWYPGCIVVTRTVTTFEPVVTEWQVTTLPEETRDA